MKIIPAVKNSLKATPAYTLISYYRKTMQIADWRRSGCPVPPPHVLKQKIVSDYARRFGINTLIETGTFMGDMIDATKQVFDQIYSIELSESLFEKAKERFKNYRHIKLIQGDSGEILPQLLEAITPPCLFWLDGHYSGGITARGSQDTPVLQELSAIFENSNNNHVVLIDDARCFTGQDGYPTINTIKSLFKRHRSNCVFHVEHDIIQVFPLEWK